MYHLYSHNTVAETKPEQVILTGKTAKLLSLPHRRMKDVTELFI